MSCIDAAIIKALVEHIGMDPEDVPVGGTTQGHTSIETYRDDCVMSTTNISGITLVNVDTPADRPLRVGDVVRYVANGVLTTWYIVWQYKDKVVESSVAEFVVYSPTTGSIMERMKLIVKDDETLRLGIMHQNSGTVTVDQSFSKESGAGAFTTTDAISATLYGLINFINNNFQPKTT